jgi:NAD(P)-dependent dehydrogenase (short-subunit alcohol dehydrogenase family)
MIMSKTILVTGTSNGFGADIVTTLAAAGHRVFATMREMNGRHRAAAEALRAKGIHTLELDVTDNASVDAAFAELLEATGGTLDVLVNNAGLAAGASPRPLPPNSCATCSRSMSLASSACCAPRCPRCMRKNRGW